MKKKKKKKKKKIKEKKKKIFNLINYIKLISTFCTLNKL